MNISPIVSTDLSKIESELADAKLKGFLYCRINSSMPFLTRGSETDWATLDKVVQLFAKYGRKPIVCLYAQVPNSKYWRQFYEGSKDALWADWVQRDAEMLPEDWKNPNGVSEWLIPHVIAWFREFAGHWPVGTLFQPDNEPGDTQDSRRSTWRGISGEAAGGFLSYLRQLAKSLSKYALATCPCETQNAATYEYQMDSTMGSYFDLCSYYSRNVYDVPWLPGDTPTVYAGRFWLHVKSSWCRLPLLVSEHFPYGCPADLVEATFKECYRLRPSGSRYCPYRV